MGRGKKGGESILRPNEIINPAPLDVKKNKLAVVALDVISGRAILSAPYPPITPSPGRRAMRQMDYSFMMLGIMMLPLGGSSAGIRLSLTLTIRRS
jgi:hypothetical protein